MAEIFGYASERHMGKTFKTELNERASHLKNPLIGVDFHHEQKWDMHSPIEQNAYGAMNGGDVMNVSTYPQNLSLTHQDSRISDSARSHSRSTEGTEASEQSGSGGHEPRQNGAQNGHPQQQIPQSVPAPVSHLGMALQNVTGIEPTSTAASFPAFNNTDFIFQNNSLLQYPNMLSQFRNGHMGFDTKPDLQTIHSQMQMREAKPYKCTQCIKSFANSSYLSQHMRIHLGIKPFGPCQYCGKKFTQLSHLQQHIRTHTGEKPYKCKYQGCEKAFSQLSNLQSHSRCHQTDKPFKCNSCYKCFSDEQSLLDHIPKHKESKHLKVHICPFCGKSYTQSTYLQKHMTKHADRTRGMRFPGSETYGAETLDLNAAWNAQLPTTMPEDPNNAAHPLAFPNNFNAASMMAAANQTQNTAGGYPQATLNNSTDIAAFQHLLNFRNNRYFDYQNFSTTKAQATERPTAGFNMITPLENIQRYTQQGATATAGAATHQQFGSNIINPMKPTSY